jgi:hypothetical protein
MASSPFSGACPANLARGACVSRHRHRGGIPTRRKFVKRDTLEARRAKVVRRVHGIRCVF